MASAADFDWNDNDAVTLRAYGSIAVYENPHGSVVLRQQRDALEDEDSTVVIPVHDAELITSEILSTAKASREGTFSRSIDADRENENASPAEERQPRLVLLPPAEQSR